MPCELEGNILQGFALIFLDLFIENLLLFNKQ